MLRREWCAHDDFDDRRREPIHFVHARDECVVEQRRQFAPSRIALDLIPTPASEFLTSCLAASAVEGSP